MPLDLGQFASKLRRYREQLKLSLEEVSNSTGIELARLTTLENGSVAPTGDEVLIFADFYKCDYHFFISNEMRAAFERVENLYRRFGPEFSKDDRWRVQEFLFLCDCEEFLLSALGRTAQRFKFTLSGAYFKGHAEEAATQLRQHFDYDNNTVPLDIYSDFRKIGIHVLRRRLDNSNISGLTVHHPTAGPCILVNYSEDIYRQRFTAAHEAAHALFDQGDEVTVSFSGWDKENLMEIRANTFASRYLLPPEVLRRLPVTRWTHAELVHWATNLKVSTRALTIALNAFQLLSDAEAKELSEARVSQESKEDPELKGLTGRSLDRKRLLLERGLSTFYVSLCFDGVAEGAISAARAAEMLLVDEQELAELGDLFHVTKAVHD